MEHVLQRYRDVWVPIETYPFLAVDVERVRAHCAKVDEFPVFTNVVGEVAEGDEVMALTGIEHDTDRNPAMICAGQRRDDHPVCQGVRSEVDRGLCGADLVA
jgi:hypothetical protein